MTICEAEKSLKKWQHWADSVRRRWRADSPMIELADRMVQEATERLRKLQKEEERG